MSRDFSTLRVFQWADGLVVDVYRRTRALPPAERYGLQSQIRRAATSVPTNIVEGSARRSEAHYQQFLETALGSACEVRYLLGLAVRLEMLEDSDCLPLIARYSEAIKGLAALIARIDRDQQERGAPQPRHNGRVNRPPPADR
jgi:four helix bundle protein